MVSSHKICTCPLCGHGIYEGDRVYTLGDYYYHTLCAETDLTAAEVLERVDAGMTPREMLGLLSVMDLAQITGSASSYARKYALNGLFCIDDTKDPDTMPPEEDKPKCRMCGKVIRGGKAMDGHTLTAEDVSKQTGGLCKACFVIERSKNNADKT